MCVKKQKSIICFILSTSKLLHCYFKIINDNKDYVYLISLLGLCLKIYFHNYNLEQNIMHQF